MDCDDGRTANPKEIVLVLIDGDRYIFRNDLLKLELQGGETCAQRLQQAILDHLGKLKLKAADCQLVVRVYANFKELSTKLECIGIVNHGPRSISSFAAGFTASVPHCEFIDSGESTDAVYNSISNALDLFVKQLGCRHVFLAACHTKQYRALVAEYVTRGRLFALVRPPGQDSKVQGLCLCVVDLESVFQEGVKPESPKLNGTVGIVPPASPKLNGPIEAMQPASPAHSGKWKKPCIFHARGPCPMGSYCPYVHDPSIVHENKGIDTHIKPQTATHTIPVNAAGERIDLALPLPTDQDQYEFAHWRTHHPYEVLCHHYHLRGHFCNKTCGLDHTPVSEGVKSGLRHLMRYMICSRGSACRWLECPYAHGCTRPTCTGCPFGTSWHAMDDKVFAWVAHDKSPAALTFPVTMSQPAFAGASVENDRHEVVVAQSKISTMTDSAGSKRRCGNVQDAGLLATSEDLIDLS